MSDLFSDFGLHDFTKQAESTYRLSIGDDLVDRIRLKKNVSKQDLKEAKRRSNVLSQSESKLQKMQEIINFFSADPDKKFTSQNGLRADHKVVKLLHNQASKAGVNIVRYWQSIPFINMGDSKWSPVDYVRSSCFENLLFKDYICYSPSTIDLIYKIEFRDQNRSLLNPYMLQGDSIGDEYVSAWCFWNSDQLSNLSLFFDLKNDSVAINRDSTIFNRHLGNSEIPQIAKDLLMDMAKSICGHVQYLSQCPEYIVREKRNSPVSPKQKKTDKQKPWLRNDLPSLILIDPAKVKNYGHPSSLGEGRTTRPHQRRAHWRALQSDRYKTKRGQQVWVRSSWIGDKEWIHNGNHYKVISNQVGNEIQSGA